MKQQDCFICFRLAVSHYPTSGDEFSTVLSVLFSSSIDIIVIETPGTNNLTYVDEYGVHAVPGDNLLFKVRAKTDVHVFLTRFHVRNTFWHIG